MQNRTFLRTMLDIFLDNTLVKTVVSLFSFVKEQQYMYKRELTFLRKMPEKPMMTTNYDNRFLFNGKLKVENGK